MKNWIGSGTLCVLLLAPAVEARAQEKPKSASAAPAAAAQKTFDTPKAAADALVAAAEKYDLPTLKEILGKDGEALVVTKDPVQDKNQLAAFAAKAHEKSEIVPDEKNPNLAIFQIGDQDWPMPIPIVRNKGGRWLFDSKAGRQEILYRRIGSNELDAIEACHNFVDAQHEYALAKHDGSNLSQYAQKIISTEGKQDGLVWRNSDGTFGGPLGEELARVIAEGYSKKAEPYHGYYFKVLKGQGPAAPLGKLDFVVKGVMIGGFALVAAPADYRVTGVKTFIVSHDGVVYEKDLGPKTIETFKTMERYNPDKTWSRVEEPSESPDSPTTSR
ncbi:MAG TPA: DUF2950 domain-containing protein [Thermoanaerobaculia bacterium]|nr:DUF2950 domain-containing protein [Thermoanaerobaculia bacterium]